MLQAAPRNRLNKMEANSTLAEKKLGAGELLYGRQEDITILTLNRPNKMNALNSALVDALLRAVEEAACDGTRTLILRGNGKNFSAGFDFTGYEDLSEGDLVLRFIRIEQLLQALYHAPFNTIALAHGRNFGAAVDIICACSHRIATPDSSFRMPGLRFGLVLGTRRLVHRIGTDAARRWLLQSTTFDGQEALMANFINETLLANDWPTAIDQLAQGNSSLTADATAALLRVTIPDTRDADMADLVISASRPGLKERIRSYRASNH